MSTRRSDLVSGFWFLTVVVSLLGPALVVVTLLIDKMSGNAGLLGSWVISPESARTILGTIAGSLITIASLTASLTIVTLQLLSNQYTPRAVRGFLRRKISQIVSGTFIGIFLYCLMLLVTVRAPGNANDPFVPSLGVMVAVVLSLLGLMLLVMFIHALANTIQVSTMTSDIARDTVAAIDNLHPDPYHPAQPDATTADSSPVGSPRSGELIYADRSGYVRSIDTQGLLHHIPARTRVELLVRPGDFITLHTPIATARGPAGIPSAARRLIVESVRVAHERDIDQDPAFGIRQLVDIALRAISPGINDPTTAVTCIGYLRGIIDILAERSLPTTLPAADSDALVVAHQYSFTDYLEPMTEIARYAVTDARVTVSLLEALAAVAETSARAGATERQASLVEMVHDLAAPALAQADTRHDQSHLERVISNIELPIDGGMTS